MKYYLAIDIGASSGRHIIGYMDGDKLKLEEIYRFKNQVVMQDNHLTWDIDHLFNEIINGLKKCKELNIIPSFIGIDTWAVDYVLLDKNNKEIKPCYAYRDNKNEIYSQKLHNLISFEKIYQQSGIQYQPFNSIYQLYFDLLNNRLEYATDFLMIPEYLNFKLTGKIMHEYTNSSTTALIDINTCDWNSNLIKKLGFNQRLFKQIYQPGTIVGNFKNEIKEKLGFDSTVVLVASHDTASAVIACPSVNSPVYLSSGTWSLIGVENKKFIVSKESLEHNFTNEGGADHTFRYLKNIMGLWMLQNVKRELNEMGYNYDFPSLIELAKTSTFDKTVDVNSSLFLAPKSMINAIKSCFDEKLELKDVLSVIYHSLAKEYSKSIDEIEKLNNRKIDELYIIGGGCQDQYLNSLTKKYSNKKVYAGPVEATSIGNLIIQLIIDGVINNINEGRELIKKSFTITEVI